MHSLLRNIFWFFTASMKGMAYFFRDADPFGLIFMISAALIGYGAGECTATEGLYFLAVPAISIIYFLGLSYWRGVDEPGFGIYFVGAFVFGFAGFFLVAALWLLQVRLLGIPGPEFYPR